MTVIEIGLILWQRLIESEESWKIRSILITFGTSMYITLFYGTNSWIINSSTPHVPLNTRTSTVPENTKLKEQSLKISPMSLTEKRLDFWKELIWIDLVSILIKSTSKMRKFLDQSITELTLL